MTTRREFLGGSAALLASLGLPGHSLASASGGDRKFIFIFAMGGWDPTFAFTDQIGNPNVYTDPGSWGEDAGDIRYVTNEDRPSTKPFFDAYGDKVGLINGMLIRSVNHMVCQRLVLTGSSLTNLTDWPTLIGAAQGDIYTLPSLVVSGPSFPASMTEYSSIMGLGGQLEDLVTGSALLKGHVPVQAPTDFSVSAVDEYLTRRAERRYAAAGSDTEERLTRIYRNTFERVRSLKIESEQMVLATGRTFQSEVTTAVEALSSGISRCASVSSLGWDTHAGNPAQAGYFERMFDGLLFLMNLLETTPGTNNPTLADETTVVVVSEMGRTPYISGIDGKDHWMYTSAMVIGSGVKGNTVIGGYDDLLNAKRVDLKSGQDFDSGTIMTPEHLGATLLKLADVDPEEHGLGEAIDALIA